MIRLLSLNGPLFSPVVCGLLVTLAIACLWMALAPARRTQSLRQRQEGFLAAPTDIDAEEIALPFSQRVLLPLVRRLLRSVGGSTPQQSLAETEVQLQRAGQPWGLTALDYYGLRLLLTVGLGGGFFWLSLPRAPLMNTVILTCCFVGLAYYGCNIWLTHQVEARQREVQRALPNALDMLTIGVEAGLAFESALLRVSEQWDNALTQELRQAVMEMRVGTPRNVALKRVADRTDVADLHAFVAVIAQSSQLGVSIAQVLHNQAATMRQKRRQRAEAQARQSSVKMALPLVFLVFPAMFAVILGPALPGLLTMMGK